MKNTIYLGQINPKGWLREYIGFSLDGYVGHLDCLVPDLIVNHDIYGQDRINGQAKLVELGRNDTEIEEVNNNEQQFYWWNSESQSNWTDGFYRSSILYGEEKYLSKAKKYIDEMLKKQDPDGYMGIYTRDLRFQQLEENGELWAQTTLLRGMLGYYEACGDQELYHCIERAVECIMKGYPLGNSHPFCVEYAFSGVGHGLMIVDVFWRMYQLTKNKDYLEYATWLYEEYSNSKQEEVDLQLMNAQNKSIKLKGHGVHTYEQIRALIIASILKPEYKAILETVLEKVEKCIVPSGGCIGDEWILKREADADTTGYEFCSLQELLHTYDLLLETTENTKWANKIEWLYYNAVQGMLHRVYSAIMYLKTDNCYTADERKLSNDQRKNPRYKYSSTHQDAAVCCVPNAGRITPYFVQAMYKKRNDGIAICLYGPSEYTGEIQGNTVNITQHTNYPFTESVQLQVELTNTMEFPISLRFPEWADTMVVDGIMYIKGECKDGTIVLKREWKQKNIIPIQFSCRAKIHYDMQGRQYVTRGPLLYVLEIPSKQTKIKEMPIRNCGEWSYSYDKEGEDYVPLKGTIVNIETNIRQRAETWNDMCLLVTIEFGNNKEALRFIPMAHTILRQTTFAIESENKNVK